MTFVGYREVISNDPRLSMAWSLWTCDPYQEPRFWFSAVAFTNISLTVRTRATFLHQNGPYPATSASKLGSPLPHLRAERAYPSRNGTRTSFGPDPTFVRIG